MLSYVGVFARPSGSAIDATPKESVIGLRKLKATVVAAAAVAGIAVAAVPAHASLCESGGGARSDGCELYRG
ncbi:hypothetical protein [Streptomyces sp. NPDC002403]